MNEQLRTIWTELVRIHAAYDGDRRRACWMMDRVSYDRIRAIAMTEEQETARAYSHATMLVPVLAVFPLRCPACTAGPFATMDDLAAHAEAMSDPANREPGHGDTLLGLPIDVRGDGGAPHLEAAP